MSNRYERRGSAQRLLTGSRVTQGFRLANLSRSAVVRRFLRRNAVRPEGSSSKNSRTRVRRQSFHVDPLISIPPIEMPGIFVCKSIVMYQPRGGGEEEERGRV